MIRWISRYRCQEETDAGIGMIMVIGLSFFMMILVMVLLSVVQNSLTGSKRHDSFDAALTSAESGVDQTLGRLQRDYVYYGADFAVPSNGSTVDPNPLCKASPITAPTPFANATAERTWARSAISTLLASHPECLQHSTNGDYVAIKPSNIQSVYAEGWTPNYGATHATTRLIKAEYLFSPYAPSDAVLTACDLEIDSSTTITTAAGSDPTLAAVHSNCKISTQGNPTATGPVSSTGQSNTSSNKFSANTGGTVTNTPAETIPVISAREIYAHEEDQYPSNWYDMCPDGTVRAPSSDGPCTSSTVYTTLSSGGATWRGFQYTAPAAGGAATWSLQSGASDGIYYFQAGNVQMGTGLGNPSSNAVTVIAAASDETACPKVGGNISWDHDDLAAPYMTNTFMVADADLTTGSNFHAGGVNSDGTVSAGLFVAGDQINMQTSSQGAYGAVIAGDQCAADPGEKDVIKNPAIYYDPNAQAPFTSVINTTLWLEYPGSN